MRVYKSKLGLELIIPISLLFGIVLYMIIRDEKWIALGIILATISFICHVFLSIKYSIEKENLNIKCGFFINQNIDISTIQKISETYNPLSSPAGSIDRLEIKFNKFDSVLISPKDKKAFINALLLVNPTIEVQYRRDKKQQ
jgi:Bacterial PH domain